MNVSLSKKGIKRKKEVIDKIKYKRASQKRTHTSSIEIKIQNYLKQLGIIFFSHHYINIKHSYQCDVFIPSINLIIECDGDYWHNYPIGTDIDHVRTSELIDRGFKVLRLWECDIKNLNIKQFENEIQKIKNQEY
jgi:very-short-patch-repair endonuclease